MIRKKIAPLIITAVLLLMGTLPMAFAARQQQVRVRRLNACVGLIPKALDPDGIANPDPYPYVFYVLDQRKDWKPDGWEFYNPAAPAFVTREQQVRWNNAIQQGQPLRPDMGAYWETAISAANFDRLVQMDVIYIPISPVPGPNNTLQPMQFTEEQRQLLTRLADAGVTIWIDWAVNAATVNDIMGGTGATKDAFFTNLDFATFSGDAVGPTIGHPLLTQQYVFQGGEAVQIGSAYGNNNSIPPYRDRAVETRAFDIVPSANFTAVVPLPANQVPPQFGAYVAAARFGAGYVVATAGNVGGALARMIPSTTPRVTTQDLQVAEVEDLKFAYNVFAWSSEVLAGQKNARHTAQGSVNLSGLIEQGAYPYLLPYQGLNSPWPIYQPTTVQLQSCVNAVSPLIFNGAIISPVTYVNHQGQLVTEIVAMDATPGDDYDGNGFVDDGLAAPGQFANANTPISGGGGNPNPALDYSVGQPYDRFQLFSFGPSAGGNPFRITGICIGEVPEPGAGSSQGAKAYLFITSQERGNLTGLYSLPAPRPGATAQVLADYWQNGISPKQAPDMNIDYWGGPAFVNVPGPVESSTGVPPRTFSLVRSQVIAGGTNKSPAFGGAANGKLVGFDIDEQGRFGHYELQQGVGGTFTRVFKVDQPDWYYPPNQESNRLGKISGPIVTAQVPDTGTGAVDTMAIVTSVSTGNVTGGQAGGGGGDTTGKVEGFILATRGDPLVYPRSNAPGAQNQSFGRRFVSARWLDLPQGTPPPTPRELMWDPEKYYEVRALNKATGYVLGRYKSTDTPATIKLLPDGTAGQVELPKPPAGFAQPGNTDAWDLNKVVLLADYSVLPQPVDQVANGTGSTIRPRFNPATPYFRTAASNQVQPTGIAGGVSVGKDGLVYYGTGIGFMCATEWRRGRAVFRWKMKSLEYLDNTGTSSEVDPGLPAYLQDYAFTAAPAAGNRIVFSARGRGNAGGTVYMLDPDAVIRFKLPWPAGSMTIPQARDVMLEGDHGVGLPNNDPFIMSQDAPFGSIREQFTVDPDTATVTFLNMTNFSLDLTKAISPLEALNTYGVDTGGKPAVTIRWRIKGEPPAAANNHPPAVIPLPVVAIYKSPVTFPDLATGNPTNGPERFPSGPVLSGDRIYLMGASGNLHELPLDPKSADPAFPRMRHPATNAVLRWYEAYNIGEIAVYGTALRRHRAVSTGDPASPWAICSPAIGDGILAVSTRRGLSMFRSPNVVVADSGRIVEASGDSTTIASTDVVLKHHFLNNEFAIPTDPAFTGGSTATILADRTQLNQPAVVRKLDRGSSLASIFLSISGTNPSVDDALTGINEHAKYAGESYLAADTGSNRCIEFNPAGKGIWELKDFQDPLAYLPIGEPRTVSGPRDVQRWIEREVGTSFQIQNPSNPGQTLTLTSTSDAVPTPIRLYAIHTLVADTNNTRVLEIVDKVFYQGGQFNAGSYVLTPNQLAADGQTPIRWYHVLVWSSQTNAQGLKLRYTSAQRLFWPDRNGGLSASPQGLNANNANVASTDPPYLPPDRYLSYTMAVVSGQRVSYNSSGAATNGFNQFWSGTPPADVLDRIPRVQPGGDSIVFLRGRFKVDEGSPATVVPVGQGVMGARPYDIREPRAGTGGSPDRYRYTQGVVDPNVPILSAFRDEIGAQGPGGQPAVIHQFNGVTSVQRLVRADARFAPEVAPDQTMQRIMTFLVADREGVWEVRMIPDAPTAQRDLFHLLWSMSGEDYTRMTGGRIFSPGSARRQPNGLVLITNRTAGSNLPGGSLAQYAGGDVFLLRAADYMTVSERIAKGGSPAYMRLNPGWQNDPWVAAAPAPAGPVPSIRWHAAEPSNPALGPTPVGGNNPLTLYGSYVPVQPNYADVVY